MLVVCVSSTQAHATVSRTGINKALERAEQLPDCQTGRKQIHSSAKAKLFGGKNEGANPCYCLVKLWRDFTVKIKALDAFNSGFVDLFTACLISVSSDDGASSHLSRDVRNKLVSNMLQQHYKCPFNCSL